MLLRVVGQSFERTQTMFLCQGLLMLFAQCFLEVGAALKAKLLHNDTQ